MPTQPSYRALFLGDVHMSNKLPHARTGADGITDRLKDQIRMWEALWEYMQEHGIEHVWILGDLFDRALVDAATLTATVKALVRIASAGGTVRIVPGNHDTDDSKASRFVVDALDSMGLDGMISYGGIVDGVGHVDGIFPFADWLTLWPMPYAPIADNRDYLAKIAPEVAKTPGSVLLMHNSIVGARHMGWSCDAGLDADEVCAGFDAVISGHFHTAQEFGSCGRYLGAPMQFSFGDEGETRGFWDVTFRRSKSGPVEIDWDLVCVEAPEFWTVTWEDLVKIGAGHYPLEHVREGDYVLIEVKVTAAEFEKLRRAVDMHVEDLEEQGFKVKVYHNVVYHHETRLEATDGGAEIAGSDRLMAEYVEHVGITKGMDREALLAVGRKIHEEVTR